MHTCAPKSTISVLWAAKALFLFFQRSDAKVKIKSLKWNVCFPRLLWNQLPLSVSRGDWNRGPGHLALKCTVPGHSPDAHVCSGGRCPVSGIRINIWTERKTGLPFVLGRGNLVSENISYLPKRKRTKPKAVIVRRCPTFWTVQGSAVSWPPELPRGCGKARHVHEACPKDTLLKISGPH